MADSEGALVERLRGGDPAALEALMSRFSARVYRLAYGITRSDADAEEIVLDVFLSLFRKIGSFEGRSRLGTCPTGTSTAPAAPVSGPATRLRTGLAAAPPAERRWPEPPAAPRPRRHCPTVTGSSAADRRPVSSWRVR
jgi:hypothetical protein